MHSLGPSVKMAHNANRAVKSVCFTILSMYSQPIQTVSLWYEFIENVYRTICAGQTAQTKEKMIADLVMKFADSMDFVHFTCCDRIFMII